MEIYLKLQSVLTNSSVYISEILWNDLIEEELSKCCIDNTCNFLALELTGSSYMDLGVKCNSTILICKYCLILGLKISSLSSSRFFLSYNSLSSLILFSFSSCSFFLCLSTIILLYCISSFFNSSSPLSFFCFSLSSYVSFPFSLYAFVVFFFLVVRFFLFSPA